MTKYLLHLLLILSGTSLFQSISAVDFVFNGFNSSDLSLYGRASLLQSRVLAITNNSLSATGRALYPSKIQTKYPNSSLLLPFYTSFIFSIAPYKNFLSGHGFVFIFAPQTAIDVTCSAKYLGLFNFYNYGNRSNHVFGIEFDYFKNQEFNDPDENHVGVDVNSLNSIAANTGGYWKEGKNGETSFRKLTINNGINYQVWVDYFDFVLTVTMAKAGMKRPRVPLINVTLNLSDVLLDEMYVGFTGTTERLVETHKLLSWSFSNSNSSIGDALITSNLPSFVPPKSSVFRSKVFIAGISVGIVFLICSSGSMFLFLITRKRKRERNTISIEKWELEYWPHRINYQDIYSATNGFSEENIIGSGGNGKVYKGHFKGGIEVAVKRIPHGNENGRKEFLAEVSSLGRLKHRNLVRLRGWCKRGKGSLILVYDYMENGSLDKRIFEREERLMLNWVDRIRVLKDVAIAILYLHDGWENRVLHRDIKSSNVLLDKDMNGRLGDFGLARMHGHGAQGASTTRVAGTVGYMAPEVFQSGRASTQTDVFGFGVLILEVICGRRPIGEGKPHLINWVWELMDQGELVCAIDERLRARGGFDDEQGERVLHLGLLCAYPDPQARPTMRQVVKILEGTREVDESEGEGWDVYLREMMKSSAGKYPTFDEFCQCLSPPMPLSESDIIVEGR